MDPGWAEAISARLSRMTRLPRMVASAGCLLLLVAVGQGVAIQYVGGSLLEVAINTLLIGFPAGMLLYTGFWMPESKIDPTYYPRLLAWVLGGVTVMFGFVLLRDLHPGVTVEWSLGTQAIALTIGCTGGLLIAVQETKATMKTEQLERQTRRLEARERALERHNEQLEQFASIVSHDLRNPLNVAQGRLELAREECDSEHLRPVADAHDRMTALIEDLLTLAREGETVRELQPVSLETVATDCWHTVATDDAALEIEIERRIRADPDRVQQLLENLFRNAVEHGSTGPRAESGDSVEHSSTSSRTESGDAVEHGSTGPRAEPGDTVEHADDAVTITVGEHSAGFYVADDGPGIPEADREAVFETGYSTADEGTGFGLAIVERIADAHGWSVRVVEADGGGARFEFLDVEFAD